MVVTGGQEGRGLLLEEDSEPPWRQQVPLPSHQLLLALPACFPARVALRPCK